MKFSYKIKTICGFFIPLLLTICYASRAQELKIIRKKKEYRQSVREDARKKMIELKAKGLICDLRYATSNNFTGQALYPANARAFMRSAPVRALLSLLPELKEQGLGIRIFDAYRPYSVTQKMWDLIHDERYVANPSKASGHNRGLAVDLTLYRLSDGSDLDMGTAFDNFTDSAHHDFVMPNPIQANRNKLRSLMESRGFRALETEWWHYSWPNDANYEALDIKREDF